MTSKMKLIPIMEAADVLGVSKRTVDRLIAGGEFSVVKVNRSTRIPLAELESYIKRNTYKNGVTA